jgi:hypothetical protein
MSEPFRFQWLLPFGFHNKFDDQGAVGTKFNFVKKKAYEYNEVSVSACVFLLIITPWL